MVINKVSYNLYSPELVLITLTFSYSGYCFAGGFAGFETVSLQSGESSCGGCGSGERGRADVLAVFLSFIWWRRLPETVGDFGVNSLE